MQAGANADKADTVELRSGMDREFDFVFGHLVAKN
jgi:hypothetical protein